MDVQLATFKKDIEHYYPGLTDDEWDAIKCKLTSVAFKKEEVVFPSSRICRYILFVSEGILASEYQPGSKTVISRFFGKNDLCTNMVSFLEEKKCSDQLFTATKAHGVLIPRQVFIQYYLHSGGIGVYFRKKLLNILLEAKQFVSIKTISDAKHQIAFLQEYYPEVLLEVPWKHIANFIGVSAPWLSRILKKKEIRKEL